MGKNKEDKTVLEWNFNSLKLAVDKMFDLSRTTEKRLVRCVNIVANYLLLKT